MKRTRLLALTSAGVIAIGAGGFALGRQVKSPADAAAEVAAPSASRLAVPVERRILSSTIITRGDVRFGDPKPVVLPPSTLKATGGNLVTQPAVKGQEIVAGKRILEVAGRPVIALVGATPAYRDMRPGDTGNDIAQLEKGLTELGLNPGTVDGRYDAATERAVELLYRQLGYDAFGPTDAQRTQLQQLRDSSSRAADGVRTAQRTYDTVLLDLRMPDRGGETLYRELCQRDPQHARRVVFMTGDLQSDAAQRFLADAGRPVIGKPFQLDDLAAILASVTY